MREFSLLDLGSCSQKLAWLTNLFIALYCFFLTIHLNSYMH